LSTDQKDFHGTEEHLSVAEPKPEGVISRGEVPVNPLQASASRDLEFQLFGPPLFSVSSEWQQLGSYEAWPPPVEMTLDYYTQYYSPIDFYEQQQSHGTDLVPSIDFH
jgi:hypothetical protein